MEFTWSKQTKVNSEDGPSERCWHSFTALGDTVYLFGGLSAEGPCNDVYKLSQSWGEFQWSKVETTGDAPCPRFRHTASVVGDAIYIIGGFSGPKTRHNDVWKLDIATGAWSNVVADTGAEGKSNKSVPAPRGSHTADVVGTSIYVFGGYGGYDFCLKELGDMFIFDTEQNSWKAVTAKGAPSARSGHASCVHKARICVYGGLSSTGPCDGVHWFDTEAETWKQTTIPGEGQPRWNHSLVPVKGLFNHKIVALMGSVPGQDEENSRGIFTSRVSLLDVGPNGMWATGEDTSTEKVATRANSQVAFDSRKNRAVLFGGFNGNWLSDVLVLDIASSKNSKDLLEEYELSGKEKDTISRKLQQKIAEPDRDPPVVAASTVAATVFTGDQRVLNVHTSEAEVPHITDSAALFADHFDNSSGEAALTVDKVGAFLPHLLLPLCIRA